MNDIPIAGKSVRDRISRLLEHEPQYIERLARVRAIAKTVRASEYLITNACNIRCKGCWFFEHDFDKATKDIGDLGEIREFVERERARGVTAALIIGGEPTLFPDRVRVFTEVLPYVSISTNGLRPLPRGGFAETAVLISLFGGGPLDDELRAIRPGGRRFDGLFDTALANYKDDPRAFFIYAITEDGIDHIDETVRRIRDNGNRVNFNFYSKYGSSDPLRLTSAPRLVEEALRARERYPEAVMSHPYYIETIITGKSHWGSFGYDVCPSISVDHPDHAARVENGNPVLPGFNAWASDCKTLNFCCTSGHCRDCRDSQAVFSWLMVSVSRFMDTTEHLKTWIEMAESYWCQFYWTKYLRDPRHGSSEVKVRSLPVLQPM